MTPSPLQRFRQQTNRRPALLVLSGFACITLLVAAGLDFLLGRLAVDTWLPGAPLLMAGLSLIACVSFFVMAWREEDEETELLNARTWTRLNDQVAVFETSSGGAGLYLVQGPRGLFLVGESLHDPERTANRLAYLANTAAKDEAAFTSLAEQRADFAIPLGQLPEELGRYYARKLDNCAVFALEAD